MKTSRLWLVPLLLACVTASAAEPRMPLFPKIAFSTTAGDFVVQLDGRRAPLTTRNFVEYVQSGHYDGTIFHRVIAGFMAQTGGFDKDLNQRLDPNSRGWGYTVFGEVMGEGMQVIDKIAAMETGPRGRFRSDVPKTDVIILKAELVDGKTAP